ncbi:cytochrome P450 3A24-like [Amphiura filiformis]|uniref:cytochrome P450 3A24-like n=1 Tax=Amphiura filiformis TaxID=82378 RepID=UPI003B2206C8
MDVHVEEEVQIEAESESISVTWLLIYTGLALLVVNQVYSLTYFWRLGIKGPFPLPLLGNFLSMGKGIIPAYDNWSKKYGKYYGMFMGKTPTLVVSDADMARQILIKDFPSFQSRSLQSFSMPYMADTIVEASGEVWRRGRSYMSPTFSGSKLKQMVPAMNSKCDIMMEILEGKNKEGKSFDSKEVFGSFVLDIVACCAYGLESDCQRNPDDAFLYHTKKLLDIEMTSPGLILRVLFPFLSPLLNKFSMFDLVPLKHLDFFANCVRKAIELRTESGGTGKKDFLQLMMDAAETGGDDSVKDNQKKKIPLTQAELIGQSLLFFFAGYETVSSTMAFASYAIAKYPDVQKRLQEEVDEMTSEGEPVSYDAVFKMEYLDQVWCESQRMWPFAFALERICNQEFTCNGKTIPNGQYLNINTWDIHHNPEYWSDPQTFNPENFSKEAKESRHPCAFMPFGAGPRQCVAMRFANLEGKIGLIRMMQKYSFELDPVTPDLSDIANFGTGKSIYPKEGICLRLVPRE